ncbi:MAG: hypothetical protein ACM3U2_01245, partial [Deltaproteobacteria bacterium]
VRDWYRAEEDPARHHRGLLIVWIAVALAAWIISGSRLHSDAPGARAWESFLAIPLVIAAALGVLEIAERRVGFFLSLAFGLLALGGAALVVGQMLPGLAGVEEVLEFSGVRLSIRSLGMLGFLLVAGIMLAHVSRGRDGRRRFVLTSMLAVIVAANCAWGLVAVRRTSAGDRELEELRVGLARLPSANQCTFVALAGAEVSELIEPPAQLVHAVASLWPDAELRFASSWEDAAGDGQSASTREENPATVFVTWSPRSRLRGVAPAADLKAAAPPFHYHDLEIIAYVRDRPSLTTGLAPP